MKNHDTYIPMLFTARGLTSPVGRKLIAQYIQPSKEDKALLISIDEYLLGDILTEACIAMGFQAKNITLCETKESVKELLDMDRPPHFSFIYVGEGNTYQVLDLLTVGTDREYSDRFLEFIKNEQKKGTVYCGSSAGAAIAGTDIELVKDYAEKERNFSRIENLKGIDIFPGTLIPHYTEEDFMRYFYRKSIPEIQEINNHYRQLGFIDNESIIVWDPEETLSLLDIYYDDVNTMNNLVFFLEVASNTCSCLLICDGMDNDVRKVSRIETVLKRHPGFISLGKGPSCKIPLFDIPVYKIYRLRDHMYGFRLEYGEKRYDMMICR